MHQRATILFASVLLMTSVLAHPLPDGAGKHWELVSTEDVRSLRENEPDLVMVNVLPRIIHDQAHIPGSVNIPLGAIATSPALPEDKATPMIFYCMGRLCMYSPKAADMAHQMGYTNLMVYRDGLLGWRRARLPIASYAAYPTVDVPMISARELAAGDDAYLLDLRPADHFRRCHVAGSVSIDLELLHEAVDRLPRDRHIVLIDHKGKLTLTTGRFLASRGLTRVSRLDGGFNAWVKSGLAVRQGMAEASVSAVTEGPSP